MGGYYYKFSKIHSSGSASKLLWTLIEPPALQIDELYSLDQYKWDFLTLFGVLCFFAAKAHNEIRYYMRTFATTNDKQV